MLRMKYIVTLTLVALLMASGAAFAGPWIALEYVTPLTPTSAPVPNSDSVAAFGDVATDYWAWGQIEEAAVTATAASDFIVQGYGDGSYQPTWEVTRGQMAVFIARAGGYTAADPGTPSFQDVPDSYWAFSEIEQCVTNGVVQGYADYFGDGIDAYLPSAIVDRGQMAVYIYRAASLATAGYQGLFSDVADDYWSALEIEACADAYIVQGYPGGIYLPNNTVTRSQMAVFVWRGLVRDDGDVVLGGPAVTDDAAWAPAGDDTGALFYPDVVDTATGANTVDGEDADLPAAPGAVVFVVLDAAQIGDGDVVFEVSHVETDDNGTPADDTDDFDVVVVDGAGATLGVTAAAGEAAVNVAGVAYLVASYQIDSTLTAEDYTLTITLPNGNVTTMAFTVE